MSQTPASSAENDALRSALAAAIYAGGDESEWLTTVDGSPNSASHELADRALSVLLPMLTENRCPGCGNVLADSARCSPVGVDVTQPAYRYLADTWGYCVTLSRHVGKAEGLLWPRPIAPGQVSTD